MNLTDISPCVFYVLMKAMLNFHEFFVGKICNWGVKKANESILPSAGY
jgi:hypothetical protein